MHRLSVLLRDSFSRHADALAVEGQHWLLSYRDLDRESARMASALRQLGVGPGSRVVMRMQRSPAFIVAMLGIVRCGAAYVPVDLANPPARQRAILEAAGAAVGVADAAAMPGADEAGRTQWLEPMRVLSDASHLPQPLWPDDTPEQPLYVMFTSGSTGTPKGVLVPQRGVVRLVHDADYAEFRADARWAHLSSPAFDASTLEVWGPLLNGGACVVQEVPLPSLDQLGRFLSDQCITDAWLTAALFNAMVDDQAAALAGLRQLLTGGERASPSHMRRFLQACPGVRLINGYGPTENTTFSLCHRVAPDDVARADGVPIGRPIHGSTALVVDGDGRSVPDGTAGELWVGGAGVALGYLGDDDLTAARFVQAPGVSWYRTGDLARRRADGVFEFLGRADRQVKIQGHRIELDEVERVLSDAPGVGDVAVMVRGDTAETRHLVAAFGGRAGAPPPEDAVRRFAESRLPPAMVPHVLHPMARLPLNLSGKLDRRALEALVDTGTPSQPQQSLATDIQRRLAAIWQRHLGPVPIGARSDFVQCGGNSLIAIKLSRDIQRTFARAVDPVDVLRHRVLEDQAAHIGAAPALGAVDEPDRDGEDVPLMRCQRSVLAVDAVDPSHAAMLVTVAWYWPARAPALPRLRDAFGQLIERHPILRTAIHRSGEQFHARLLGSPPPGWWTERAWPLPDGPADTPQLDVVGEILRRPIDLSQGPMRVDAWPLGDERLLLAWTVNHFAIDEAGIENARKELSQLLRGQAPGPVYGSPFAFSIYEAAWTDDAAIRECADRMAGALRGREAPLPTAPRHGHEVWLPVPPGLGRQLFDTAARQRTTPFTPLLTAWGLALQRVFGPAHRFVVTPFSRRIEPELLQPLGYFLDLRIVEAGVRDGESLPGAVRRVHASSMGAQHKHVVPLDRVIEELTAISPSLRAHATQFAFTWRIDPHAAFEIGHAQAQQLWVPQVGARFSACLHAESNRGELALRLEGIEELFATGRVGALTASFFEELQRLLALDAPWTDAVEAAEESHPGAAPGSPGGAAIAAAAARHWRDWLGVEPASPDADFLASGGNSLKAMRMAASLRVDLGIELSIPDFLRRPTFGSLCALLASAESPTTTSIALIGPKSFERLVLLIPGYRGSAAGMYPFASALQHCMPPASAVAVVDMHSVMLHAPLEGRKDFIVKYLHRLAKELGTARLVSVAGYSLGGLLGIDLVNALAADGGRRIPLWMMDTYAPRYMQPTPLVRAARTAVALVRAPVLTLKAFLQSRRRKRMARSVWSGSAGGDDVTQWQALMAELAAAPVQASEVDAVLLQSSLEASRSGLLLRPGTNGWRPSQFGRLRVTSLGFEHDALRHEAAEVVAREFVRYLPAGAA